MPFKNFFRIKERIFKLLFIATDKLKALSRFIMQLCQAGFAVTGIAFIVVLLLYLGFPRENLLFVHPEKTFRVFFILLFLTKFIAEVLKIIPRKSIFWIVDGILLLWGLFLIVVRIANPSPDHPFLQDFLSPGSYLIISTLLIFSKFYKISELIRSARIPPSLLFALSFLVVIFAGAGLLMLPRSQNLPLSFLDALFTSTSAVCVTGLVVVDTSASFTLMGKTIIISLIQAGGLGIMTFTLFFGFLFAGNYSFRDSMVLKDIFSAERLGGMMKTLLKVIGLTFSIELIGAVFIWFSADNVPDGKLFFSLFHSVSAFCNAGFSTLKNNLLEPGFAENNLLSFTIAALIILGGIGFPVLLFLTTRFQRFIIRILKRISGNRNMPREPHSDLNTRIVLVTTFLMLSGGTIFYYFFEKENSLGGIPAIQKFVVSFFGSVSARTAGFNLADLSGWSYPTIFLMLFLMWVGASPGSTGGGIKTTTFAVAIKTAINFFRGRERLESGHREIGENTIYRVLSVITLSLVVIGIGFFGLMLSNPVKNPVHLLFETVSAYSTVGLSMVNTATLDSTGKIILICMMYIGRIGPLTFLSAIFIRYKKQYYRYPKQDLIIT